MECQGRVFITAHSGEDVLVHFFQPPNFQEIQENLEKIIGKEPFVVGEFHAYFHWLFLVPLKGGIGGIVHPPIGRKDTT